MGRFSFAGNNPIGFNDPFGLYSWPAAGNIPFGYACDDVGIYYEQWTREGTINKVYVDHDELPGTFPELSSPPVPIPSAFDPYLDGDSLRNVGHGAFDVGTGVAMVGGPVLGVVGVAAVTKSPTLSIAAAAGSLPIMYIGSQKIVNKILKGLGLPHCDKVPPPGPGRPFPFNYAYGSCGW